jgi:N utilization substance protein A
MSQEIFDAVRSLGRERGLEQADIGRLLEDALLAAYRKTPDAVFYARVNVDLTNGDFRLFELQLTEEQEEELVEEIDARLDPTTGDMIERQFRLDRDQLAAYEGQITEVELPVPEFGYISSLAARQVIIQGLRRIEAEQIVKSYANEVNHLVTGQIQQASPVTLVKLREGVEAVLPRGEQTHGERYQIGARMAFILTEASLGPAGPSLVVSRRHPELVAQLFEEEIPELQQGLVEITGIAREAGSRSKIAVVARDQSIDPVGACIGPRGARVRNVVSELKGEKIDIVPMDAEPARFLARSLSPAKVREVLIDDDREEATMILADDQVALAVGRGGENVRLATKLTGWKITIVSETEFAQTADAPSDDEQEAFEHRCHAILTNSRRCPNATLSDSRYCGLPKHQALLAHDSDNLADLDRTEAAGPRTQKGVAPAHLTGDEAVLIAGGMPTPADIGPDDSLDRSIAIDANENAIV